MLARWVNSNATPLIIGGLRSGTHPAKILLLGKRVPPSPPSVIILILTLPGKKSIPPAFG